MDTVQRSTLCVPSSPFSVEPLPINKEEYSTLKSGLRRVKLFAGYVSTARAKKASSKDEGNDSRSSNRSEDSEYRYVSDTDSLEIDAAMKSHEKGEEDCCVRHSFSYETLASGNYVRGSQPYTGSIFNGKDECLVYYSSQKSNSMDVHVEKYSTCDQMEHHISKYRTFRGGSQS